MYINMLLKRRFLVRAAFVFCALEVSEKKNKATVLVLPLGYLW